MISKLFRFQFKELSRLLFPIIGISAALTILMMIPTWLLENTFLNQLSLAFIYIILVGGGVVMTLLVIVKDYHNFYGKRAYLMQSFPASAKELFLSRILYYLVSTICIILYTFLQLLFLYRMIFYPDILSVDLRQAYQFIKPLMGWLIIYGASAIFLTILMGMSINTLGAGRKLQRFGFGGPLLIYFLLNIIMQICSSIATIFLPLALQLKLTATGISHSLITQSMFAFYGKNIFDDQLMSTDFVIGIGNIPVFIVMGIVLAFIVQHYMKKKVCLK